MSYFGESEVGYTSRDILYENEREIFPVRIEILPSVDLVDSQTAQIITDQLRFKPKSSFILSTGNTFIQPYDLIRNAAMWSNLDLNQMTSFNQDEYVYDIPIGVDHPGSYKSYMKRNLFGWEDDFRGWNSGAKWYIPNGGLWDPQLEAAIYEKMIRDFTIKEPIDLAVISIGPNKAKFGHIGFNEPGADSHRDSITTDITPV